MKVPEKPLSDLISSTQPGFACGQQDPEGPIHFRMNNVDRRGDIALDDVRRVPEGKALPKYTLRKNDILFNLTNSPNLVGKTALVKDLKERTVFSNHFLRIRTNDQLDPEYAARWLQWQFTLRTFEQMCHQWVSQATVSRDRLLALRLPVPPIAEQRRIANILNEAVSLIDKKSQSLAKLDELQVSTFLEMFGDPEPAWELTTVEQLAAPEKGTIRTGPFGSQLLHEEFTDEGIAVLGIDNAVSNRFAWAKPRFITPEKYEQLRRYTVHPGDVLITIMGTVGRCAIVPHDIPMAINTKHLCCITADRSRVLPEFLHAWFLHHSMAQDHLQRSGKGAIMTGLNMSIIKGIPVRLPPLALQELFVQRLCEIENNRVRATASTEAMDELFSSLQSRAFRGEL